MTINEIRKKYLEFMKSNGHAIVQSSSLVPENDPTTLFTAAGMQPMINYILGAKHTAGNRIADTQKCFRSQDIEEIGDNRHTTFFEMLGNWSFGDYFKKEQVGWMFKFLTDSEIGLGLDKNRLYFSCYSGNEDLNVPKDEETKKYWLENGVAEDRIYFYDDKKNWWSRSGAPANMPLGEPGGPDSEMFFDFDPNNEKKIHENSKFKNEECHPNCDCGRFVEIGNSVFIQYKKTEVGLEELLQKNVDFGGGLTRMAAATIDDSDIFSLDIFGNAKTILENLSKHTYTGNETSFRIILDHIHAATFLIGDGVVPGNKDQMYFVRRLIRRAIVAGHKLDIHDNFTKQIGETFVENYKGSEEYLGDNLSRNKEIILSELEKEENKFRKTLSNAMKKFDKAIRIAVGTYVPGQPISENYTKTLSSDIVFEMITSDGLPKEVIKEEAEERDISIDWYEVDMKLLNHKNLSRTASEGMFKGGLADQSEITTALHSACHLMLAGMRKVLGENVTQAGSNINSERLRFDFTFDRKVEEDEIEAIENYVNRAIEEGFTTVIEEMEKEKAREGGVTGAFWDKYPEIVKVYNMIGEGGEVYSRELCGGPHIHNSTDFMKGKTFRISKQEAVSAGVRRFKGVLE
ncbi:MAG: alanine--tRNA ligase [Candidatus Elulimicrobiales bacterium]|nr:alanine--tRNA ligase [Candidatus Elulimicrobiales bacterium]